MSAHRTISPAFCLSLLALTATTTPAAEPLDGRIDISADYRYKAHELEPADDAKALACREAFRLAVVNSPVYREQTASVVDSPLLRDLAYTLANSYVQDRQVVEQTERDHVVSCRVKGRLPADESARVIRTQLTSGPAPAEGLDQNRVLRLLSVKEEGSGTIAIQYQALKRLDWLGTHYQGGLRDSANIMVDFFDDQGLLVHSERYEARRTPTGEDVMSPGAVAVLKVAKPRAAKTYHVWLVK